MKKTIKTTPLLYPMPAVLIGTYGDNGVANAMTVGWAAACNADPPCIGIAIRNGRLTWDNIRARRCFSLNMPRTSQSVAVDYLGIVSGRTEPDKVARAGFTVTRGETVDAPMLNECPISIELSLRHELDMGCHTWFVGEVRRIHADEDILTDKGTVDVTALQPLMYLSGVKQYAAVGAIVNQAFQCGRALGSDD